MENKFTITITDDKGIKQYNIHQVIKKVAMYFFITLFVVIFIGVGFIYYLTSTVSNLDEKILNKNESFDKLKKQADSLTLSLATKNKEITQKEKKLVEVKDRLGDIEELIGLSKNSNKTIDSRVDIASITSLQISMMLQHIPSGWPVAEDRYITSRFGYRNHPTLKKRHFHRGIDMRAKMKTPVLATADGIVEFAGYHKSSGFGYLVILVHPFGFKTTYAHLHSVKVKVGDFVKKGEAVALSGKSGISSGPHLHYEVRYIQRPLNPANFINWSVNSYKEIFKKEKRVKWQSLIKAINSMSLEKQR